MTPVTINYVAILVTVIVNMILGALWYSPVLFANAWMKEIGKKMDDLKGGASTGYIIAVVADIVMAYVMAHFVKYAGATTAAAGAMTGFWLWLGFVAAVMAMSYVFEGRSAKLFWINAGLNLVTFVVTGTILAVWR